MKKRNAAYNTANCGNRPLVPLYMLVFFWTRKKQDINLDMAVFKQEQFIGGKIFESLFANAIKYHYLCC